MKLFDPSVAGVCGKFCMGLYAHARFLKKPEIMPFPIGKGGADDMPGPFVDDNLCFYRVPLFLP